MFPLFFNPFALTPNSFEKRFRFLSKSIFYVSVCMTVACMFFAGMQCAPGAAVRVFSVRAGPGGKLYLPAPYAGVWRGAQDTIRIGRPPDPPLHIIEFPPDISGRGKRFRIAAIHTLSDGSLEILVSGDRTRSNSFRKESRLMQVRLKNPDGLQVRDEGLVRLYRRKP